MVGPHRNVRRVAEMHRRSTQDRIIIPDEQDRQWQGLYARAITIAAGADVKREILLFAQRHRATVVLAASGAISAVSIATQGSLRTVTRQGCFSILSLVGSYIQNYNTSHDLDGGLSVSLAGPNGHVIGGRVEQFMVAVEPVEVVVGTF